MPVAGIPTQATTVTALLPDGRVVLNGQELKRLRQQIGLSQEALAERCLRERLCVSIASIKRAEASKSVLYRTARHLATAYKVGLDSLLDTWPPEPCGDPQAQCAHEVPVDTEGELRRVVALYMVIDPAASGVATATRLVQQFGGTLLEGAEPLMQAMFGLPQAYLSDAARCMQCACELAWVLGVACRLILLTMHEWTAGGTKVSMQVTQAMHTLAGGRPGTVVVHPEVVAQLTDRYVFGPAVGSHDAPWRPLLHALHSDRCAQLPLIGRYAEIQQFKGLMEITRVCQSGHVAYARGVPGIGKSRLMGEFADIARQSHFGVHQAAVLDFGVEAGGTALGQLVRSLLRLPPRTFDETGPGMDGRLRALGLPAEHEMFYRAMMGLPQSVEQAAVYSAMVHATRTQRGVEALRSLVLREAITRSLVVILEDLHWGDTVLFDTLGALLAETQDAPVIWVLSSRVENDPLEQHIRPHCDQLPLTVFGLVPLRPLEAETLALQFNQVQPAYRQRCVGQAQGNPLFLTQMLLSGSDRRLPDSLKRLVQSQLDRQSPTDRKALRAASAIGQRFALGLVREVLSLPDYSPDGPQECHLVRQVEPGVYLFVHDLVMQCIYESMVPAQREFLHLAIAAVYRQRDTTLCALHLDRARSAEAPQMFLAAIREKLAAHLYKAALDLAEQAQAIDYAPRDDHALALFGAEASAKMGQMQQAKLGFQRAQALALEAVQQVDAVVGLARTLNVLEELETEERLIDATLPLARSAGHESALASLLYLKGNIYFPRGDFELCRYHHEQALKHARSSGVTVIEARALSGLGDSYYAEGRMQKAHEVFSACLALCREHGHADVEASNLFMLGTVRIYLGKTEEALRDALDSAALGLRVGNRRAEIVSRLTASWVLLALGDPARAREEIETALQVVQALQATRFEPFLLENLARVCLVDGQRSQAQQHILRARGLVDERKLHRFIGPWILGTLALMADDAVQRSEAIKRGVALLADGCVGHNHYRFRLAAAEACLLHGDVEQSLSHIQALQCFTAGEPCAWVEHHAVLVRAYAAWLEKPTDTHRRKLAALRQATERAGFAYTMPVLYRALQSVED